MKNLNKKNQLDTSKSKTNLTYSEEQIKLAVQYAIGDDGFRAKEVISILRCLAEEQSA